MNETSQETVPQEPDTKETPIQPLAPIDPDLLARFEAAIAKLTEATEAASRVFQGDDSLTIKYVNERVTKLDEKIERVITTVAELSETLDGQQESLNSVHQGCTTRSNRIDRIGSFCAALAPLLDKHLKTSDFTAVLPEKRNGTKD